MFDIRNLLYAGTAVCSAVLLASCASDVPVPEDAKAQEWNAVIKKTHSSWQPPRQMPKGNPEYEAAFAKAEKEEAAAKAKAEAETKAKAAAEAKAKAAEAKAGEKKAAAVPVAADAKIAKNEPLIAHSDEVKIEVVGDAPNSCLVNGDALPDKDVENYLRDFSKASKNTTAVISWSSDRYAKRGGELVQFCRGLGIKNVKSSPDQKKAGKTASAAPAPAKKYVVDRSGKPTEYTVVAGDSLSLIAKKQYKDGNLWFIIYQENKALLKSNANKLRPGMKLSLPVLKLKTEKK